jgi:hypothetical protein
MARAPTYAMAYRRYCELGADYRLHCDADRVIYAPWQGPMTARRSEGNPTMAQAILDMFPDSVSAYGLLGCASFTMAILLAAGYLIGMFVLAVKISFEPIPRSDS